MDPRKLNIFHYWHYKTCQDMYLNNFDLKAMCLPHNLSKWLHQCKLSMVKHNFDKFLMHQDKCYQDIHSDMKMQLDYKIPKYLERANSLNILFLSHCKLYMEKCNKVK